MKTIPLIETTRIQAPSMHTSKLFNKEDKIRSIQTQRTNNENKNDHRDNISGFGMSFTRNSINLVVGYDSISGQE